jgi:hypothetical protein
LANTPTHISSAGQTSCIATYKARGEFRRCLLTRKCAVPALVPGWLGFPAVGPRFQADFFLLLLTSDQPGKIQIIAQEAGNKMTDSTQDFEKCYEDAVRLEKAAWQELQALDPGSPERAEARTQWAEAISRTNQAWRRLTSQAVNQPHHAIQAAAALRRSGSPPSVVHHGH